MARNVDIATFYN